MGRQTGKSHSNPDPFTGIDQADNLALKSIWSPAGHGGGRCLFHVVNTALNVVASKNLAWQERKAEPFVMTPLACGNPFVGFVPTRFFGARRDGITLGTAMAISGAAVSPNQGYHSSPIVGLLLMLHYGSEQQKADWIEELLEGRQHFAFGITEPERQQDHPAEDRAAGAVCDLSLV